MAEVETPEQFAARLLDEGLRLPFTAAEEYRTAAELIAERDRAVREATLEVFARLADEFCSREEQGGGYEYLVCAVKLRDAITAARGEKGGGGL